MADYADGDRVFSRNFPGYGLPQPRRFRWPGARLWRGMTVAAGLTLLVGLSGPAFAQDVAGFRAAREAYIDGFRRNGELPVDQALALEQAMIAALGTVPASDRAALLYEIASMQRMQGRYEEAIASYETAIAEGADGKTAFDAWIGIARSHAFGTRDHGGAEEAIRNALRLAGPAPDRERRYQLASYLAQVQIARGEYDAGLANALNAARLAADDEERYYAELDTADALQQLGQSCTVKPIADAKTFADETDDGWGACRRAIAAAGGYYARSAETAARLGWNQLRAMSEEFENDLQIRLFLIEQQASIARMGDSSVFSAEDAGEVLISDEFVSGGESIDLPALGDLIGAAFAGAEEDNPRVEFLQAIQADIEGDTGRALAHLERAAELLETERSSLFDIRQRGTVVENRPELVQNLGLRLIALRSYDRAFDTFESIRARGLGDLAAAYERLDFSAEERAWLAELVDLESQESALLTGLAERAVAGETEDLDQRLDALEPIRARRHAEMENPQFPETLARLAEAPRQPVGLTELAALVGASGVPVLFYWVTASEVIVWVVSPQGMEVKSVFLPGPAVIEKSRRVTATASNPNTPFDEEAARQLHAYLIQPFEHLLTGEEVIIVPQGPLVTLPFEALIDGRSGAYLAQQVAVSYAPSAGFAAKALQREPFVLPQVAAIYDAEIEADTSEIARLGQGLNAGLNPVATGAMSADEAIGAFSGQAAIHALLHGVFEQSDPLQSYLALGNLDLSPEDNAITAAELLAADWRQTRLAVFSSCESAQMNVRISNEVYGLSWAPLVGGAQSVVTSRWRVLGPSNADWMEDFYARLAAGPVSPAIAAAGTMRRMIGEGEAHPYYWAGPQVFGR